MQVLIVGGGSVDLPLLRRELAKEPHLIIAADSGGKYLHDIGQLPHVLLGDFDSLNGKIVREMGDAGVEVLTYPVAKDQTDLELAVDLCLARGATKIRIIGGLGDRLDHTLGNIGLLLKSYRRGVPAFLCDSRQEATVTGSAIQIPSEVGMGLSLIPLTLKVSGITTTGLKFPLNNADLHYHQTLGIHNECTEKTATISLKDGILLIITFKERSPAN